MANQTGADICLVLEGTYPYVLGGVSSWTHKLILSHPHLSFSLACILPPNFRPKVNYEIPDNVVKIDQIFLQNLPKGVKKFSNAKNSNFFQDIELPILHLQYAANMKIFKELIQRISDTDEPLGSQILLDSKQAWQMLLRMYHGTIGEGSFLNFFWSWRGLLAGMYSILLADIPQAQVYHTICTGYAGLLTARAHQETGKPCLLTEHGIYTNERRIEITAAQWLNDQKAMNLNLIRPHYDRDLKDYWIDTFSGYSKLCYEACEKIVTIYEGNTDFQISDGADPEKIQIIPNGVDFEHFNTVKKSSVHPPTVALIGRVVSIKDIKTFIKSVGILAERIPKLRVWILGPTDEEIEYYQECVELTQKLQIEETLSFLGKVNVTDFLGEIDVLALTSISEAQPLAVLEAGALGIPFVATDVGACRELAYGRHDEDPPLGEGGAICSLSNPTDAANRLYRFFSDSTYYQKCSKTIQERVKKYYHKNQMDQSYSELYEELLSR